MNIILFAPDEFAAARADARAGAATPGPASLTLPRSDPRAEHILTVLRRRPGDTFDAGLINGPRGKGTLTAISPAGGPLALAFAWEKTEPPPLPPVTLIIGLPRPQTARKILNEATSLGVSEMRFVATERGEPSYAQSTLWTTGEYRRHLAAGAAQAFCTRIPRVTFGGTLAQAVAGAAAAHPGAVCVALDNYEAPMPLVEVLARNATRAGAAAGPHGAPFANASENGIVLCLGPERGWGAGERGELRAARFAFAHLGPRVLRAETAVTAALTLALAHLGRL